MGDWIDITLPINDTMIVWRDRARPKRRWEKTLAAGDHCNVSSWELSAHSGTHMDAPLHFVAGGKSIDEISPEVFFGPCEVLDLQQQEQAMLDERSIQPYIGVRRLLVKTAQSAVVGNPRYLAHRPLMNAAAAQLLVDGGLLLIGTDCLSVDDSEGAEFALHHIFLGTGCVIVEGLQLAGIEPGPYTFCAAPLRIVGAEASPVRAMLRKD